MNYIIIEVRTKYSSYYIRALAIVRNGACYEIVFNQATDVIYNKMFDEDEILVAVNKNGLLQMNIGLKELGSVSTYSDGLWEKMKIDHDVNTYDTANEDIIAFEEALDKALHGEDTKATAADKFIDEASKVFELDITGKDTDDDKQKDFEDALLHDEDPKERI